MQLTCIHPTALEQERKLSGLWVYTDSDPSIYRRIKQTFQGVADPFISPEHFQQQVIDLRPTVLNWVDKNLLQIDKGNWYQAAVYKNPYSCEFFLHACWISTIRNALMNTSQDLIVVSASTGMMATLKRYCRSREMKFRCVASARYDTTSVWKKLRSTAGAMLELIKMKERRDLIFEVFGSDYASNIPKFELLVESYIHDGDIDEHGDFKDRYLPGLEGYFSSKGISSAVFPSFFNIPMDRFRNVLERMKRSRTVFVPFEIFVSNADFANAVRDYFFGSGLNLRNVDLFEGVEIAPLLHEYRTRAQAGGVTARMLSKVPEKMVKHDLVPRVFIDWFENQPMDRGIVMGLKRSMPECRIIGARQYLAIGNWLNCFVTSHEVREGVVPSEYWCMGDDQKELFQRYDKVGVYQTMPATRFKHVFEHDPSDKLGDGLAVLLTYSETESLRIISVVLRALEKGDYGFESIDVRAHPDTDLPRFKKKVKDLFPSKFKTSIRWSENSIEELIVGARMVVTGGSGSAVEALCHGRPVAVVGRQAGLTMNPIEPIDRLMWKEVYSWRELSSFLDEWVTEPPVDDQGRKFYADGVRSRNFECIDFNSCEAILSLLKE